ncbi:hypothetical protein NFI96_030509 [Prochilodus magdalenae]|nr:hypothetical protein NFI96_030509 [Prochilodus magdalenae]
MKTRLSQVSSSIFACGCSYLKKLYNSTGRELRRALFSLKQIFQDDKDLVHEFVVAEGLTCLIKVGAEADQNYQNYILRDGAVGWRWRHQVFWTCHNRPFILVLTTVPPHTDSLGVSTKTKAGLVTEDDPLPF